MDEILINYLQKKGFSVISVPHIRGGNFYAVRRNYGRFIFLEWPMGLNYPSIKISECDNLSMEESRSFFGYIYAPNLNGFKSNFKYVYVKRFGKLKYYFTQIMLLLTNNPPSTHG